MADQQHITRSEAPAHDGSVTPAAIHLPDLYFRARCASPPCKALLGGFHVPARIGMIVFSCPKCGLSTVFKLGDYGITPVLAGPLVGSEPCPPARLNGARTRGQRGGKGR